ncbi:Rha family transcriptional regulator [Salmonella enterica subsp. enterica]|nr:Rha family transcriptional regulator [Salmonella enterica subsp. enterica serovar Hvittingfoss]
MHTANAISTESPKVFFKDGRLVTTSQSVADYFDKQHKDVLRKIDTLDCSPEFTSANFCADVQTIGIGNGAERETRCFLITKDGFMFLVMGFTGKKAARLKEAYIAKFNHMEAELRNHHPDRESGESAVIIYFKNGVPVCNRSLLPNEIPMTFESFREMAMMRGEICVPFQILANMTATGIAGLIEEARGRYLENTPF